MIVPLLSCRCAPLLTFPPQRPLTPPFFLPFTSLRIWHPIIFLPLATPGPLLQILFTFLKSSSFFPWELPFFFLSYTRTFSVRLTDFSRFSPIFSLYYLPTLLNFRFSAPSLFSDDITTAPASHFSRFFPSLQSPVVRPSKLSPLSYAPCRVLCLCTPCPALSGRSPSVRIPFCPRPCPLGLWPFSPVVTFPSLTAATKNLVSSIGFPFLMCFHKGLYGRRC